jgi:hypothetical protein
MVAADGIEPPTRGFFKTQSRGACFLIKTAACGACLMFQCCLTAVDLLFVATHLHGRVRPKADIARNSHELPHLHNPSTYYNVIMCRQKGRYMSDIQTKEDLECF